MKKRKFIFEFDELDDWMTAKKLQSFLHGSSHGVFRPFKVEEIIEKEEI